MLNFVLPVLVSTLIVTTPSSNTLSVRQEINTNAQVNQRTQLRATSPGQEARLTIEAKRRELIREYFVRMLGRFEAAIERLEKLIERLEARMDKIGYEDKGDINDAKAKLADAKAGIEALQSDFEELLTSDTPKEVFAEIVKDIREVKKQLVEVHSILVHIIADVKGLRVGQTRTSPTPASTP